MSGSLCLLPPFSMMINITLDHKPSPDADYHAKDVNIDIKSSSYSLKMHNITNYKLASRDHMM